MGIWYNGGTIAVESGSASVVGTTTLFNTKTKVGDSLVTLQSDTLRINQITAIADDNNITIDPVWAGTTDSGLAYNVIPTSPDWGEVSEVAHDLANFLASQATFFPTDGKPSDDEGGDGSFAVDPNSTPPRLYVKTSGAWDDGTSLGGPMGATGKGYGGTSTDSKTLAATGSMSFTTQSGLAWQAGNRIRIASAAAISTKWMEGIISAYSSTTLTVTIDKQGSGTGSASDWTFGPAGEPGVKGDTGSTGGTGSTGSTGATGLGYGGTSTTSRAIGSTGTMSFTIGTGKAYQVGDLVKVTVSTDVTQWMKGKVSSYTGGSLAIDVSESNGSGTYASWNVGLAGETGEAGSLEIGTVTTLDAGEDATAEITGDAPDQTLNLGIPKGADGTNGADGQSIQPDARGLFSDRSSYDAQLLGFVFLSVDGDGAAVADPCLFVRNSATAGDWSNAISLGEASSAFLTPEHFGATGDGTTDDTEAFQTAAATAGVESLYMPAPAYVLTDTITITDKNFTLCGNGNTKILCQHADAKIEFSDSSTSDTPATTKRLVLKDCRMVKDITTTSGSGGTAVKMTGNATGVVGNVNRLLTENFVIEGPDFTHFWDNAFDLTDIGGVLFSNSKFYNVASTDLVGSAIKITRDQATNLIKFYSVNTSIDRWNTAFEFVHRSASAGEGTIEGIEFSNGDFVSVRYGFRDDNTDSSDYVIKYLGLSLSDFDYSRALIKLGAFSDLHVTQNEFAANAFGEISTPAPLEGCIICPFWAASWFITDNRIFRNNGTGVNDAASAILLPTDANVARVIIDGNSFEGWTSAIHQAGTASTTKTKILWGAGNLLDAGSISDTSSGYDVMAGISGTWTPALKFGGANTGMTGTFAGTYARFGNLVFASCSITLTAKGTATGTATISGFPVSAASDNSTAVCDLFNSASVTAGLTILLAGPGTTATVRIPGSSGSSSATHANFNDTTIVRFSIVYRV